MSTETVVPVAEPAVSRRVSAHKTVSRAATGALIATVIGLVGWIAASVFASTVFLIGIVLTVAIGAVAVIRKGRLPWQVWAGLAVLWGVLMLQNWVVHKNGGILVAGAAWFGMFWALRSAGTSKWLLALLAYPLVIAAALVLTDHSIQRPFGVTWLWVPAVLAPVLGVRALLAAREPKDEHAPVAIVA